MKKILFITFALLAALTLIKFFCGCSQETSEIEITRLKNIPASVETCYYPLSDKRNPSHTKAEKLYNDYVSSGGKFGLDLERYNTKYNKEVRTDVTRFYWRIYKLIHPGDVVIHDDNDDAVYRVYTNSVDENIFSPITYVSK